MEYKDDFGVDEEGQESQTPAAPASRSQTPVQPIGPASIKPTGTGCRTCAIFVLLVGAVLAFVYFYYQGKTETPSAPSGSQPGQTQQK